jgi:hypothetical protein
MTTSTYEGARHLESQGYGGPDVSAEPEQDETIVWRDHATFRVLSYYFVLRWNDDLIGTHAARLLRRFTVQPDSRELSNAPVFGRSRTYSLVRRDGDLPSYTLLYGDDPLVASHSASIVLDHFFWHVNTHAFRTTGDFFLIHAGAVTSPAGVAVLLSGPPGSGKSTLVTALVRAGFGYLTDEAAAIDPISRLVHPYPRPIALKRPPGDFWPDLTPLSEDPDLVMNQWHVDPDDIRSECLSGPAPVGFVLLLRRESDGTTEMVPVSKGQAAVELGRNAISMSRYRGRALPLLSDLVKSASTHRLTSGDLEDAVGAVVDLTGSSAQT